MARDWATDAMKAAERLLLRGLLASCLVACAALPARADSNPSNDSAALTVRVTPQADVGVVIDASGVTLDHTLQPGATAYTSAPVTVTIVGNVHPQELNLAAANTSAVPVWTLDTDEVAETDQLQLYALFAEGRASAPSLAEFAGTKNLITAASKRAGFAGSSGPDGDFENNTMTGGANMDNIMLTSPARQLWLRMDPPPYTSTDSRQDVQITITATRSNL